jgi:hypothetical protein
VISTLQPRIGASLEIGEPKRSKVKLISPAATA